MPDSKIYCGSGKILPGKGDFPPRLKVSFNDKDRALLEQHKNAKGYTNLIWNKRREADKYGNTHYGVIDTWQPSGPRAQTPTAPTRQEPSGPPAQPNGEPMPENELESMPFS